MVRILCLHGWATNTEIFNYQIQKFRIELKSEAEFVVLQAPNEVPIQRDPVILKRFKGKYYAWYNMKQKQDSSGYELEGLSRSLACIKKHILESAPYDGVMGFSQGGAVAMLLLALQNKGDFPGAFKFAVFVSPGFVSSTTMMEYVPKGLPVAFFLGARDVFLPVGLTQSRFFLSPMVIVHNSGHRFPPLTAEVLSALRKVMARPPRL